MIYRNWTILFAMRAGSFQTLSLHIFSGINFDQKRLRRNIDDDQGRNPNLSK